MNDLRLISNYFLHLGMLFIESYQNDVLNNTRIDEIEDIIVAIVYCFAQPMTKGVSALTSFPVCYISGLP